MQGNTGLAGQSLKAAAVAAYVGSLVIVLTFQFWRYQTGADARMCPIGSRDLTDWCTIGELSLALLFDFLWALYGTPFALVITIPCAIALGSLAPPLERRADGFLVALVQYGLGITFGVAVGLLLQAVTAGLIAACAGVWTFRRARYVIMPRSK